MTQSSQGSGSPFPARRFARLVLVAFVLTFITSRVVTFMIMARRIPDLYLYLGGTHVHHLNYGIFLLVSVGAYLLFTTASLKGRTYAAVAYGIGLALTFDEFGMWLHLGGGYWQRASFDAIVVVGALLALAAFAPPLRSWRSRHVATALITLVAAAVFGLLLSESFRFAAREQPRFERLEQGAPR